MTNKRKTLSASRILLGNYTAGPIDSNSNQRPVFPNLILQESESRQVANDLPEHEESTETAMAYLQLVRVEAASFPAFKVAQGRPDVAHKETTYDNGEILEDGEIGQDDETEQSQHRNIYLAPPHSKWQNHILQIFRLVRSEEMAWDDSAQSLSLPEWRTQVISTMPTMQLVKQINIPMLFYLLHHLKKKMSWTMSSEAVVWIWCLLVLRLPALLVSDDINLLRDLGKKAGRMSHELEEQSERRPDVGCIVNVIILIVSRIYGQQDLEWCWTEQ